MRTIRLVPVVLVLALLWVAPSGRAAAQTSPVDELLALVNAERAAAGAPPLALRADLTDIAGAWSVAMAASGVLAHNDAYFSPEVRRLIGPGARAENVAYAGDIPAVHRVLMASAPHRVNLLDARSTVVGLGAVFDGTLWWVTQAFLAAPAPLPAPPAAPVVTTSTTAVARLPEAEASLAPVTVALTPPAPVVAVAAPAAPAPLSIEVDLQGAPEPVPATSALASGSDRGALGTPEPPRTGVPRVAWVAIAALALATSATGAVRASRGARA